MAEKITMSASGALNVPDNPIIPFIEGDGIGVDIWPAAQMVMDAAAKKHGKTIAWKEVLAGEKAFKETGNWLPDGDNFCAFAFTLTVNDRVTDGRAGGTYPEVVFWQDLIGLSYTPSA